MSEVKTDQKVMVMDRMEVDSEEAFRPRKITFELKSLDEIVEAGSLFFWALEHLSPILSESAKLEGYELDEENEGVTVTLSESLDIPEKVWREFHIRAIPWNRDMVRADDLIRNWITVPCDRRDDVVAYIAEQLTKEK